CLGVPADLGRPLMVTDGGWRRKLRTFRYDPRSNGTDSEKEWRMNRVGPGLTACVMLAVSCSLAAAQLPALRFELMAQVQDRPVLVAHDGVSPSRIYIVEQAGRV